MQRPPRHDVSPNLDGEACVHQWEPFHGYTLRNFVICMQPMCGSLAHVDGAMVAKSELYHLVNALRMEQGDR